MKVNPIAKEISTNIVSGQGLQQKTTRADLLIVLSMSVYSILVFGNIGGAVGGAGMLLLATLTYFAAMYVFYGVTVLAYKRRTLLLWTGVGAAFLLGYTFAGLNNLWSLLTAWSMFFAAGVIAGRLNIAGWGQERIYVLGSLAVAVLITAQFLPLWPELMKLGKSAADTFLANSEQSLIAMGYNPEAARESVAFVTKMFEVVTRLIPASTVMSALLQFSIAYMVFLYRLDRQDTGPRRLAPFHLWKMPFGIIPVVMVVVLLRIFGGETATLMADNVLAVLSIYYCVTGLALAEYFLSKLHLSRIFKAVFYFMLFLTGLAGFFIAALLGFIDSFADWRKVQQPQAAGA